MENLCDKLHGGRAVGIVVLELEEELKDAYTSPALCAHHLLQTDYRQAYTLHNPTKDSPDDHAFPFLFVMPNGNHSHRYYSQSAPQQCHWADPSSDSSDRAAVSFPIRSAPTSAFDSLFCVESSIRAFHRHLKIA